MGFFSHFIICLPPFFRWREKKAFPQKREGRRKRRADGLGPIFPHKSLGDGWMAGWERGGKGEGRKGEDGITNKTDLISTPSPLIPPPPHIAGEK